MTEIEAKLTELADKAMLVALANIDPENLQTGEAMELAAFIERTEYLPDQDQPDVFELLKELRALAENRELVLGAVSRGAGAYVRAFHELAAMQQFIQMSDPDDAALETVASFCLRTLQYVITGTESLRPSTSLKD